MKREIEFRAKDITDKWQYGSLIKEEYLDCDMNSKNLGKFVSYYFIRTRDDKDWTAHYGSIPVKVETIGQFTGLCDKNGKKIYEGDIVNILYDDNMIENCVVVFGDYSIFRDEWGYRCSNCGFALKFDDGSGYTNLTSHKTYRYEVVGNIYDNGGSDEECDN